MTDSWVRAGLGNHKDTEHFDFRCRDCGSTLVVLDIEHYEEYCKVTLTCAECETQEVLYEED